MCWSMLTGFGCVIVIYKLPLLTELGAVAIDPLEDEEDGDELDETPCTVEIFIDFVLFRIAPFAFMCVPSAGMTFFFILLLLFM